MSRQKLKSIRQSAGPLYKREPDSGYYQWKCPICGSVQEDPAHIKETSCRNGHVVQLAVIGWYGDGWQMIAKVI